LFVCLDGYMPMSPGRKGVLTQTGSVLFSAFRSTAPLSPPPPVPLAPVAEQQPTSPYVNASAALTANQTARHARRKKDPYENFL
jgi:hypothetical protein